MAGKFVDLAEAAKMIGVTPDALVEMRSKGTIFGYRDGSSWKFKNDEVERVIRERGVEARGGESGILGANDDEIDNLISGLSTKILAEKAQEEPGSVLVSEQELGVSATGGSTIIGKQLKSEIKTSDSDLRLADDSSKDILGGASDKLIAAPGNKLDAASASDVLHGSDINITAGSGTGDMPKSKKAGSSIMNVDDDLMLGEDDDDISSSDSALDEEIMPKKSGSTGKGSDVTLGSGDSGINLAPSDSGLSLEEEPLDLGGGSGVESLELPEDEDELLGVAPGAKAEEGGSALKSDNEFLLSAGSSLEEDESDSGSQVIALEDSESFDQEAATMLKPGEGLADDAFQPVVVEPSFEAAPETGAAAQPMYVTVPATEAPYSVWNVISLGTAAGLLALAGMMMVDLMLNMWSFDEPSSITTGLMDGFVGMLGMK
jgi:hypothetical protein